MYNFKLCFINYKSGIRTKYLEIMQSLYVVDRKQSSNFINDKVKNFIAEV